MSWFRNIVQWLDLSWYDIVVGIIVCCVIYYVVTSCKFSCTEMTYRANNCRLRF